MRKSGLTAEWSRHPRKIEATDPKTPSGREEEREEGRKESSVHLKGEAEKETTAGEPRGSLAI